MQSLCRTPNARARLTSRSELRHIADLHGDSIDWSSDARDARHEHELRPCEEEPLVVTFDACIELKIDRPNARRSRRTGNL